MSIWAERNAANYRWRKGKGKEKNAANRKRHYIKNRKKYLKYQQEYKAANADKYRAQELKRRFGITPEQYDEILQEQNGCCGVCHRPATEFSKRLAVDHDHKTGDIRGLLCWMCNRRVIGRHRSPAIFDAAASYLRSPRRGWLVPPRRRIRRRRKT